MLLELNKRRGSHVYDYALQIDSHVNNNHKGPHVKSHVITHVHDYMLLIQCT